MDTQTVGYKAKAFEARNLAFFCLIVILLEACSSLTKTTPQPTVLPVGLSDMISGKVDVGGYELFYKCRGQGSPTVILEAGGPSDSSDWDLVMIYFGETTRICAYDRANLGNSDKAPRPRTYLDMVRDLHILLKNAPIEGPYILVGHSMGGMLVRLFAGQYPDDVVGLVLVDAAHPEMGTRLLANLPPKKAGEPTSFKAWRRYGDYLANSTGSESYNPEGVVAQTSNEQIQAVKSLGDLPLVVISRNPDNPVLAIQMPPLPADLNAKLIQMWQDLQAELMALSSNSTRVIADHSGHMINFEEPRLIVEAIHKLVKDYRQISGEISAPVPSQTVTTSHPPVILRTEARKEKQHGKWVIYHDTSFTDPDGDAIAVVNTVVSTSLPAGAMIYDDVIQVPAEEQKGIAHFIAPVTCGKQFDLVVEYRFFDKAGNLSEPMNIDFSCPAPPPNNLLYLIIGTGIVLALLVGTWLLVRKRHARQAAASPA